MEPPVHLKSHFSRGRRYLVAVAFQIFMAEESAEFYPVRGKPKPAIVIDLERLWGQFTQLADDKIEFTKRDVAKVAGVSVRMIRRWQQCGWLPANAPFSTAEPLIVDGLA